MAQERCLDSNSKSGLPDSLHHCSKPQLYITSLHLAIRLHSVYFTYVYSLNIITNT